MNIERFDFESGLKATGLRIWGENPPILYSQWYWIENLQYRIRIETTETQWVTTHQPAAKPEQGDAVVNTHLEFIKIKIQAGIEKPHWADNLAAILFDNRLGKLINKIRPGKEPFQNAGVMLHPNRLL